MVQYKDAKPLPSQSPNIAMLSFPPFGAQSLELAMTSKQIGSMRRARRACITLHRRAVKWANCSNPLRHHQRPLPMLRKIVLCPLCKTSESLHCVYDPPKSFFSVMSQNAQIKERSGQFYCRYNPLICVISIDSIDLVVSWAQWSPFVSIGARCYILLVGQVFWACDDFISWKNCVADISAVRHFFFFVTLLCGN